MDFSIAVDLIREIKSKMRELDERIARLEQSMLGQDAKLRSLEQGAIAHAAKISALERSRATKNNVAFFLSKL